jgi:hypothetical protein
MLLTSLALAGLIGLAGLVPLTTQALTRTAEEVLEEAPALVVRRLNRGGWDVMPETAVAQIRKITGVTGAFLRIFGTVTGPRGPLTIVGRPPKSLAPLIERPLKDGEAAVGPGVAAAVGSSIVLEALGRHTLNVVHKWPKPTAMVTHSLVVTTPNTAREILGIPEGYGSDLAVEVFHDDEATALIADLRDALPFPVRITRREEAIGQIAVSLGRRATLSFYLYVPSLIGLFLLIIATIRERLSNRQEAGLLKALGWTTSDVFTFHLLRAVLIGMPGAVIGVTGAFFLVTSPGVSWPLSLFYGWDTATPPNLALSPSGVLMGLAIISGAVLVPWITAAALPSLTSSTEDPADLLRGG